MTCSCGCSDKIDMLERQFAQLVSNQSKIMDYFKESVEVQIKDA